MRFVGSEDGLRGFGCQGEGLPVNVVVVFFVDPEITLGRIKTCETPN